MSSKARILIVEDDGIIAKGLERRLSRMQYNVAGTAMDGETAVKVATEIQPDIILMDIQLGSGIDGIEAAEQILTFLDVPIIFLTAYSDDATIGRAKQTGPFGYVLKPYEDKDLQTSIEIGLYKHKMQRRLRENEQWLAATLASIGDGVIATDEQGRIRLMNTLGESLTGWKMEEAAGKHLVEVFEIRNEQTRETVPNPVLEVLATGEPGALAPNTLLISRDGTEYPLDDSAAPILNGDGKLAGAVLVFRDVTERRRLEELLRQTQKMESLGRLAGGIAHDFNNLLTIILGTCELMLEDSPPDSTLREFSEEILEAGRRAASLTQQISAFSRKQMASPRILSVNDAARDMAGMARRLIGPKITFQLELAPDPCTIRIDPAQLGQVILNLVVNARDAMVNGGTLTIGTEISQLAAYVRDGRTDLGPGPYVMLRVSDTGRGIAPEIMERVFEPFFTTKETGSGTGLGLATVYGIVQQNGGHVEAVNEEGAGATFRIFFPAVDDVPSGPAGDIHARHGGTETVLVVEDSSQVRHLTARVLESLGYTVLQAANGREGVELSKGYEGDIHLLLTDLVMPEMGGRLTAESVQTDRPNTRVLFMSGYSDDVVIHEGIESERVRLLRKPFTLEELATHVREALDGPPIGDSDEAS